MKEVILYVYGFDQDWFVSELPIPSASNFKGRMIGVETDLPLTMCENPKEGDVVYGLRDLINDRESKNWLVVELCDSAMKSFQ